MSANQQINPYQMDQPPPTSAPVANPPDTPWGKIARVALPVVAAVAAGSNPALARGVAAAGNIMDLQSTIADRQQRLAEDKQKNDILYRRIKGLLDAVKNPEHPLLSSNVGSTRMQNLPTAPTVGGTEDEGALGTPGSEGSLEPSPRLQSLMQPSTTSVDPLVARQAEGLYQSARRNIAMGNLDQGQAALEQSYGKLYAPTPKEFAGISVPAGGQLTGETALGKMEIKPPAARWLIRDKAVIAPPGSRGPSGEDLSNKVAYQAVDETSGQSKFLGQAEKSAFDLWVSQHPGEDVSKWLGMQPAMYQSDRAPARDELVQDIDPATGKVTGSHWENPVTHKVTKTSGIVQRNPRPPPAGTSAQEEIAIRQAMAKSFVPSDPEDAKSPKRFDQDLFNSLVAHYRRQAGPAAPAQIGMGDVRLAERAAPSSPQVPRLKPNWVYKSQTHPGKTFVTDADGHPPPGE